MFLAGIPDSGLQWFTGVSALTIKGDISRGYLNGNTPATSTGNTTANGIGASARIGWAFDTTKNIKLTPYASYTADQHQVRRLHRNDRRLPGADRRLYRPRADVAAWR